MTDDRQPDAAEDAPTPPGLAGRGPVGTDAARLSMIVAAAAMVDRGERSAFLERECGADVEMRRNAELRLDALAAADTGEVPAAAKLPEAIGAYDIEGVLGSGGMGTVLRARLRGTDRIVALKCVRAPRMELLSSLRREIHALARLRHPGIVRILDEGVHDGAPWYAMEMLEGGTPLSARVPLAPVANADHVRQALSLVTSLCAPLSYLHGEGIVHRDLKPQNVLLRDGAAVLVDFGLATSFGGAGGRERLAMVDPSVGTPLYMAPEQAAGRMVDARADIYALGCILYELLTGRPPFRGGGHAEILRMHLGVPPEPPSRHAPGIPAELDDLALRLLEKDPRRRLGHADDVAARLVALGADVARETLPRPRAYLYQPGLVGRGTLVEAVEARVAALSHRGGGILLLSAESGAGKTRLLAECALSARSRGRLVLEGECTQSGGRPLEALVEPLLRLGDSCRERGDGGRLFGPRAALLAPYVPPLPELVGAGSLETPAVLAPDAARLRLWGALGEVLGGAGPAVLILDDLQWADDLTLGFLAHLLRTPHLEKLLVVGAFRADEAGAELRSLARDPAVECLSFGGLAAPDVSGIVADMLALDETPERLGGFLAARSEGNPFFVAEYLRLAVDEGLLSRDGGGVWRLAEGSVDAPGLEGLRVPATMGDLLDRRLGGLGADAGALARRAAIVGRDVERDVLARMASGEWSLPLLDAVTELLVRHVFVETPAGFRFAHERLRDAAEAAIDPAERPLHHRNAAVAIEAVHGPESDPHAAELGRHWEGARDLPRAAASYRRAAAHAESRYALDEAEASYRRYLSSALSSGAAAGAAEGEGAEVIRSRIALGNVLRQRGRPAEAEAELLAALDAAGRAGARDATLQGEALLALAGLHAVAGRAAEAEDCLSQALDAARAHSAPLLEGRCLQQIAKLRQRQGRLPEAEQLARAAIDIGRDAGPRLTRRWETTLAAIMIETGRLSEARTVLEGVRTWARDAGLPEFEAIGIQDLATIEALENRPDAALALMMEALAATRRAGDRASELTYALNVGATEYMLGRLDDARGTFTAALALAREIGDRRQLGSAHAGLGNVLYVQGEARAARVELERGLELARETGDRYQEASVLENIAQADREEGRLPEARAALVEAVRIAGDGGYRALEGWCLGASSLVALVEGDLERAATAAADGERILRETAAEHELQLVACIAGHVELARGRSAADRLKSARRTASTAGAGSVLAGAVARLERASAAVSRGEATLCGFLPEDLTEGERAWLAQRGSGAGTEGPVDL